MSSVSGQLHRNVGKSHEAAVRKEEMKCAGSGKNRERVTHREEKEEE